MDTNLKFKSRIPANAEVKSPWKETYDEADVEVFDNLGFGMSDMARYSLAKDWDSFGFDQSPAMQTTPSVGVPAQFLQWWSPKIIETLFAKYTADEIMSIQNAGSWEDVEAVIPEVETQGDVALYNDYGNSKNSGYNVNFNRRSVVRFMSSVSVGNLEQAQSSKWRINARDRKLVGTTRALDIQRNLTMFNGFLVGDNANYGLLNDPRLPDYGTLPLNAAGTSTAWADKTYIEIVNDIRTMLKNLEVKLMGNFSSRTDAFTLVLPQACSQSMTAVPAYNSFGFDGSVEAWFKKAYPKGRVVYTPNFDAALGNQNVAYIIVDNVYGQENVEQLVQQKMFLVGFFRGDTYTRETYSNAIAGVIVGYGIAVERVVGI